MAITTQLPPLASDTFMRVKQKYAAFFVPTRILVPGYEKWLTSSERESTGSTGKVLMPTFNLSQIPINRFMPLVHCLIILDLSPILLQVLLLMPI